VLLVIKAFNLLYHRRAKIRSS